MKRYLENPRTGGSSVVPALFFISTNVDAEIDFCLSLYLSTQGEGEPFLSEYTTLLESCFDFCRGDSRGSDSLGNVIVSDRKLLFLEAAFRESTAPSWQGGQLGLGTSSSRVTSCKKKISESTQSVVNEKVTIFWLHRQSFIVGSYNRKLSTIAQQKF